jgi:hypothetical protein
VNQAKDLCTSFSASSDEFQDGVSKQTMVTSSPVPQTLPPYHHHSQNSSWLCLLYWNLYHQKQATAITTLVPQFIHSLLLFLATVHERMLHCDFFDDFPESQLFPSVHDAVLYAQLSAKS